MCLENLKNKNEKKKNRLVWNSRVEVYAFGRLCSLKIKRLPAWSEQMSPAGSCALDVPSVSKLFPMIPSCELAGAPGCRAGMSGQCAHNPGHCGVKWTRPPGLQRLFLLGRNTHTPVHTHARTSNGLTSPAKHSTPTSEHFERGATLPPRVLGSLYGHHRDPLRHPDHVWSRPCRPAVKYPSANQRGRGRESERGRGGDRWNLDFQDFSGFYRWWWSKKPDWREVIFHFHVTFSQSGRKENTLWHKSHFSHQ